MDPIDLTPQIEQLEGKIDELEEVFRPLLKNALAETAANLPLLDKAKLYILIVYSIESLLFSYLKLNDVDAKTHPVFRELTRVKQYFEKIAEIEKPQEVPKVSLDRGAAQRFIKHALVGNDEHDRQRSQQQGIVSSTAQTKLTGISKNRKFSGEEQDLGHTKKRNKNKHKRKRRKASEKSKTEDHTN